MRLPNSYGTVYKLHGKRQRPWIARKFVGKTVNHNAQTVTAKYITIGYYAKRDEALAALAAYNAAPYDPAKRAQTLSDVYNAWSDGYFPTLKFTGHYRAAYAVLAPLHSRAFADLKLDDYQAVFDTSGKNAPTLQNVKIMLSLMYDYAVVHEIVTPLKKQFVHYIRINSGNPDHVDRRPFTADEISALWTSQTPLNDVALILIYTGLRVSELCDLQPEDIDLDAQTLHVTKAKTKAGIRNVPIADKIVPVFRRYQSEPHLESYTIRKRMKKRMSHLPHDTRHTFTTMCAEKGIDQRLIDAIIGHSPGNTALKVYTHFSIDKKLEAVNSLLDSH